MNNLNNDHNVYILGAGFSADRGLPVISNFMNLMRDAREWLLRKERVREADAIAEVLRFRLRATSAAYRVKIDLENIEELFSLASAIDMQLSKNIQLAIAATIDYCLNSKFPPLAHFKFDKAIKELIENNSKWEIDQNGEYSNAPLYEFYVSALIGALGELHNGVGRNTFVTFNYDCLVEEALSSLNVPYSYGFKPQAVISDKSEVKLSLDWKSDLKVLKLHGSVNWAFSDDTSGKLTIYGSYLDVIENNLTPELIAPTWKKTFDGNLNQIWHESINELSIATRIIVIGFSMPLTDMHFKYLLAAGLENNISLREIVFVNPNCDELASRCEEVFGEIMFRTGKVKFINARIGQFVKQGSNMDTIGDFGRWISAHIQHVMT